MVRQARAALALAAAAAVALAAVMLVSAGERRPAALLERLPRGRRAAPGARWPAPRLRGVRAPGDDGAGGHGIGGQICWYEVNKESGLGEWTCPPTEDTLAAARRLASPPLAQMLRVEVEKYGAAGCTYEFDEAEKRGGWSCPRTDELPPYVEPPVANSYFSARARRSALFDFGDRASGAGYAAAYSQPWGAAYNENNLGALPPMDWGDNYDGQNFVPFYPEEQDMRGIPSYAKRDGDYWESVHAGAPTQLPFDLEEVIDNNDV